MATVEILPVSDPDGATSYRALLRGENGTQDKQSTGKTAGQALDALTAQLTSADFTALLVIQNLEPDLFFSADQQRQLAALMEQWRVARECMNPHYASVAERAQHRCEYCQAPEIVFNFPFEVEHIILISRQGNTDEANLALAPHLLTTIAAVTLRN
jgi:hypothetical protein